jgi:hypothetical protein
VKRALVIIMLAALGPLGLSAAMAPAASAATVTNLPNFCQGEPQLHPTSTAPDGDPIYHIKGPGCLAGTHACLELGFDKYSNTGIECADVFVDPQQIMTGTGEIENGISVVPVAEGYCQNSSNAIVQCANVSVDFKLADGAGQVGATSTLLCGHQNGSCSTARNEGEGPELLIKKPVCQSGTVDEVWSVDVSSSVIQLPRSDTKVSFPGNESSGHAIVCN